VAEDLLASLGMYGASLVVAFIAGLFPLFSIELFLMGLSAIVQPTFAEVVLCSVLAAVGHQVAKTITYYAGAGALEHGKIKPRIEKVRHKIEKWKNAPKLILLFSGAIGVPPLWVIGFIARPLLGIGIVPFTLIIFATRIGRFIVLAGAPLLF
jgi:membrane protein YqaA with SNARE-associated domain